MEKQRPYALMEEGLFEHIVVQLGEIGYAGSLGLSSNNEPFLDKRIISFAKLARERCPEAFLHLYTNGTLLTREKVLEIMQYLDRMVIDNYDDELKLNAQSRMVNEICKNDAELDRKIEIHLRKQNEILYTRGGQAPNNQKKETFHMPCLLPFEQLIIRPDGKVSLCCSDALGKWTMGDCREQGLMEIWNSDAFRKVRGKLAKSREGIDICRYCDTFSL